MRQHEKRNRRARHAGFTLVELMVVALVLTVLAALIVPNVFSRVGKARSRVAVANIASLENAINLFATEYERYPEDLDDLVARPDYVNEEDWSPPTIKAKNLMDPWGKRFIYRYPGENAIFDLYSLGKNGQEGGTGEDADIHNWD